VRKKKKEREGVKCLYEKRRKSWVDKRRGGVKKYEKGNQLKNEMNL